MIVKNFDDANLIACKISSEYEFNEIKKLLLKFDFEIDFSYDVNICSIQIRTVSKKVTYATGIIHSNYEDWFRVILPHVLNNHVVFLMENYKELYRHFNPLNINNYFKSKNNIYETNGVIKNYKLFTESLLNKLEGPSSEELLNNLKKLDSKEVFLKSIELNFDLGIKYAVENYDLGEIYNIYLQIEKEFLTDKNNCIIKKYNHDIYFILDNKIYMSFEKNAAGTAYICFFNYDKIGKYLDENDNITWNDLERVLRGIKNKYIKNIECDYLTFVNTKSYNKWESIETLIKNYGLL